MDNDQCAVTEKPITNSLRVRTTAPLLRGSSSTATERWNISTLTHIGPHYFVKGRWLSLRIFGPVNESEREEENGDAGNLRNNIGNTIIGNPLPLHVVSQADLGEPRIIRLDGFKEATATLGSFPFNPFFKNLHPEKTISTMLISEANIIIFNKINKYLSKISKI